MRQLYVTATMSVQQTFMQYQEHMVFYLTALTAVGSNNKHSACAVPDYTAALIVVDLLQQQHTQARAVQLPGIKLIPHVLDLCR